MIMGITQTMEVSICTSMLRLIQNQFVLLQVLQRSPSPQTSNWSGTIFCCFLQQTGSNISFADKYQHFLLQKNQKKKKTDDCIILQEYLDYQKQNSAVISNIFQIKPGIYKKIFECINIYSTGCSVKINTYFIGKNAP